MGGGQARALCPQAVVVAPRFPAYVEASKAVFAVFDDTTPLVEGLSIDEAFLDVSGLGRVSGTPRQIAAHLRRQVLDEVGLPITVGVARTKFLAKAGCAPWPSPTACWSCRPTASCTSCTPCRSSGCGAGKVTAAKLRERGLTTVGEVARVPEAALAAMLGPHAGHHLHALAHNRDPRPVEVGRRRRSIGSQRRAVASQRTPEALEATVIALVDRVTRRMRDAGRVGRTVTLRPRFDDFTPGHPVAHARPGHRLDPRRAGGRPRPAGGSDAAHPARGDAGRRGGGQPGRRRRRAAEPALRRSAGARRRPRRGERSVPPP